MKFENFSIRARLFLTLGILAAIMCVVGVMGISGIRNTNGSLDAMYHGRLQPSSFVDQLVTLQRKGIEAIELATIKQDAGSVATSVEAVKGKAQDIKETQGLLQEAKVSDTESRLIEEFISLSNAISEINQQAVANMQSGRYSDAEKAMLEQARPKYEKLTGTVDSLKNAQIVAAASAFDDAQKAFKSSSMVMVAAIMAGAVVAGFFGLLLVRSIVNTINVAVSVADRIAQGHVGNRIDTGGNVLHADGLYHRHHFQCGQGDFFHQRGTYAT